MVTVNFPQFDSQTLESFVSSLKPVISSLTDTFSSSTDSVFSSSAVYVEAVEDWAKENPQFATITAIAFGALGIIATSALASVVHAVIVGLASTICFVSCCTIGYFLVRQALATVHIGVEIVQGSPPSIPLNDNAGQANYRKQVVNDTLAHLKAGHYTSPNGVYHPLNLPPAAQGAKAMQNAGNPGQRPGNEQTRILLRNEDSLYAAAELHVKGLNPIVLDIANDDHFGGRYLEGGIGEEEDCCRRTGLARAVDPQQGLQTNNFYPLHSISAAAGVYVPHVPIFRAGYDKGYQYLNHPFDVAFGILSVPTTRFFHLSRSIDDTREKIRTFFEMAYQNGHKSVVFGAFGCRTSEHDPDEIAQITMDVIHKEFAHCFKEIVIAVPEDQNSANFKSFARHCVGSGGKVFDATGRELT